MKKLALFLATVTLLTSLASCGRRQDILNQIESEKAAESAAEESSVITMGGGRETVEPSPDTQRPDEPTDTSNPDAPSDTTTPDDPQETYKPPVPTVPDPNSKYPTNAGYELTAGINKGGDGYYKGMTADELRTHLDGCQKVSGSLHFNTPLGVLFDLSNSGWTYYNKLTGNVTSLCPDPLCRHIDCVWAELCKFEYVNATHIYFTAGDRFGTRTLYRSDLDRNHVEPLGINLDNSSEKVCYAVEDRVYIRRIQYKANDTAQFIFGVLDCNSKEFTVIYDKSDVNILAVTGGDTVWYKTGSNSTTIYKTDLSFSYEEVVMENLNAGILMSNQDYLLIGESDGGSYKESFLYHIATGTRTDVPVGISVSSYATLNDQYLYYTKTITEEEIAISALKDYYQYEVSLGDSSFRSGYIAGDGRIYRYNLATGKEELAAELSYNGVPLRIMNIVPDGDALFVSYLTYEDFNNVFNQTYGGDKPYRIGAYRYMLVDMNNGTITLLDPYNIG